MKKYEILYFVPATAETDDISNIKKQVKSVIEKNKGNIIKQEDLGKKKLAFTIKHIRHGYFIVTTFESPNEKVKDIKKGLSLITEITRYRLTIEKEPDIIPNQAPAMHEKANKETRTPQIKTKAEKPKMDGKVDLKELDLKIDELLSDDNV
ncbi:MAG: 30S ribosomal protein S6 [Candidatus Kuenenbacteria bacterium]